MLKSLLVANRGEIACRIFRTARRLGVRTIAVFSDAEPDAQHVREADEAVRIGAAEPRDSYLNIERILAAARATGAEAVHPGYGFLSENSQFAQACADAGLVFVGPPAAAIAAMGSKIVAKARMRAAGVPVLPGYEGTRQDLEHLESQALKLGLPLIIKPAAGGGGKGMKIVRETAELGAALAAARRLAESGFGDGSLLLERYLPAPRHVEVQVFADAHGNFVHLGDRDCSVQRRHQKLIEEAPAPNIADDIRGRMRAAAVLVAREIGYVSAGTVEFLFDGREFYFMEMNTRLQVEHTVTEAVTSLDLVEWQLRVASGATLPLGQEDVRLRGHAIEARVCAEDPERDFLPSAGELRLMEWPSGEFVRVDAGFASGDTVPATYDSLLGKVIGWAPERTEAAERLAAALERLYCVGVHTNERWLSRVLRSPRFLEVRHSIALLQESAHEFAGPREAAPRIVALAALVAHGLANSAQLAATERAGGPWDTGDGFTLNLPARTRYELSWHGHSQNAEIAFSHGKPTSVTVNSVEHFPVADVSLADGCIAARLESVRLHARYAPGSQNSFATDNAAVAVTPSRIHLWTAGEHYEFALEDPRLLEFSTTARQGGLTTPLPGVVATIGVEVGQAVGAGEVLMVIEAMKMEHTITAPYAGTVTAIHFARGARVPEDSELLALAPAATA